MGHRRYELGSYEEMCARHRWEVPERYNIARDVCDKHPRDKLAMVWEDWRGTERNVTFGELQDLSNRFANVLEAHGVERGDRVATLLPSLPETAAVFLGTYKRAAILLSMSVLYGDEGIQHRLRDSGARAVVTDAENRHRIPEGMVETVFVIGGAEEGDVDLEQALEAASASYEMVDTAADDPAQLYYSSGTTGLAKGILHAHRYLLGHEEFEFCHDVQDGQLFHGMGEWAWAAGICPLLGPWRYGATALVFARKGGFDPEEQLTLPVEARRGGHVHHAHRAAGDDGHRRRRQALSDGAAAQRVLGGRAAQPGGHPLVSRAVRAHGARLLRAHRELPAVRQLPDRRGARGLDGAPDAGLGRGDPRRGREAASRGRARRDLPARALEPALPARLLEPARGHGGGVRRRVVPHEGRRRARRGRLRLVRRPRRRRDHLRRLQDRPVRGGVGVRRASRPCARPRPWPHPTRAAATS